MPARAGSRKIIIVTFHPYTIRRHVHCTFLFCRRITQIGRRFALSPVSYCRSHLIEWTVGITITVQKVDESNQSVRIPAIIVHAYPQQMLPIAVKTNNITLVRRNSANVQFPHPLQGPVRCSIDRDTCLDSWILLYCQRSVSAVSEAIQLPHSNCSAPFRNPIFVVVSQKPHSTRQSLFRRSFHCCY